MRQRLKSSQRVHLVLLGTLAVAGCDEPGPPAADQLRYHYASKADCAKDWGPAECDRNGRAGGGGAGASGFFLDRPERAQPLGGGAEGAKASADGATARAGSHALSVTRGGFGASAHGAGGKGGG